MANVINTNIKSLMAADSMTINQRSLTTSMQRLSTGKRINSAADDAAGLGISTRMDTQIRGLNMAIKNANDTTSVVQTAEGAMQEIDGILQRMRELAVQSASDTNGTQDRGYLQQEVSQLSQEIDRIANTTQFNSMNVLDGSYKNKLFQIGANQGQTLQFSIGSMKSAVLGVAAGQTSAPVVSGDPVAGVTGLTAQGVKATQTVAALDFNKNAGYAFDVTDGSTGLTANFSYVDADNSNVLDLSSAVSKKNFVDQLNKTLAETAGSTIATGSSTVTGPTDFTTTANVNALKFQISVDGGMPMKAIDLRGQLSNDKLGVLTSVAGTDLAAAAQKTLRAIYDDSISVGVTGGKLVVTDAKGREIAISQGGGDGTLFGTDAANQGALVTQANQKNNITAAWEGNSLKLSNSAGGKISVENYVATTDGTVVDTSAKVLFHAVSTDPTQNYDPVALVGAGGITSDPKATFTGSSTTSGFDISFANRVGDGATAAVSFKIKTASGKLIADLATTPLAIGSNDAAVTNQSIVAAVQAKIISGVAALADKSIRATDFTVKFDGNTLSVTNSTGLSMQVTDYASTDTQATVTPTNELSAAKTLASQHFGWSETRVMINPNSLKSDLTASTGAIKILVDGQDVATAANNSKDLKDVFTSWDGTGSGTDLADNLQTYLNSQTDFATANDANAKISLVDATVKWDAASSSLVIRDKGGHAITFDASAYAEPSVFNGNPVVVGAANNSTGILGYNNVDVKSAVSQGKNLQATQVTMTLSDTKDAALNFKLNGVALTSTDWDASDPTKLANLKNHLDTMMTSLNAVHPGAQYSYELNGNQISFMNSAGGRLEFDQFTSSNSGLTADLTSNPGQGNEVVMRNNVANDKASVTGVSAVATNASLKLTGDDLVGLTISDGTKSYTLDPSSVDVNNLASTQNFVSKLNNVLGSSTIRASMDQDGNLAFADSTGGAVVLTNYSSGRGFDAKWTTEAGQGVATTVNSGYTGGDVVSNSSSGTTVVAGTAISQISIATQSGASNAMKVIDNALAYVNHERSNLGAIENRLTHTIDNLTNIVTNTAASKSRIMDTDYAAETSSLARAQIIQQAATAMLAQANQQPQSVLALLK